MYTTLFGKQKPSEPQYYWLRHDDPVYIYADGPSCAFSNKNTKRVAPVVVQLQPFDTIGNSIPHIRSRYKQISSDTHTKRILSSQSTAPTRQFSPSPKLIDSSIHTHGVLLPIGLEGTAHPTCSTGHQLERTFSCVLSRPRATQPLHGSRVCYALHGGKSRGALSPPPPPRHSTENNTRGPHRYTHAHIYDEREKKPRIIGGERRPALTRIRLRVAMSAC